MLRRIWSKDAILYNFTNDAFYKLKTADVDEEDTNILKVNETKYSIPFQYLLPNADLLNDYNNAESDPNSALNNPNNPNGQYGMEIFRDNLIRALTLVVKPLITPSD